MSDLKDSKISVDMVLFIPDYGRLEQSQCRRLTGRYTSIGTLQISPSESFQHGMAEKEQAVLLHEVCFP